MNLEINKANYTSLRWCAIFRSFIKRRHVFDIDMLSLPLKDMLYTFGIMLKSACLNKDQALHKPVSFIHLPVNTNIKAKVFILVTAPHITDRRIQKNSLRYINIA